MLLEGLIAGVPVQDLDAWTWGEVLTQIRVVRERKRRDNQTLAVIAAGEARYIAAYFGDGKIPELMEVFPFWSDEEQKRMKVNKYRKMMERLTRGGAGNV